MTKDLLKANELDKVIAKRLDYFDVEPIMHHFDLLGIGQKMEVKNETGRPNLYYQWLACLVSYIKPKQIVELGSASGISTIMLGLHKPRECKLYSVDIDPKIAWKWMKNDYPNTVKILGDDLDMKIWPKDVDLKKTDIWFIDTLHTKEQLEKEIKLYKKYWKKGAIVILDDIRMEGLWEIWESLKYDKYENTYPCHYSGFGFFIT